MATNTQDAANSGGNPTNSEVIALDLADVQEALEYARTFADQTGRTVILRDAHGKVLSIVRAAPKK
ncbi:MAG TPA: hypothetical protein VFR21_26235 [Bradyrhizobium sp.]|jgi:hypothetical protein|nr:hypothetical protein [Bradyrhizobium sp.]